MCSDLDYEEMVADICYDNQTVAMITQENGIDNMEIEIYPHDEQKKSWNFPLDDFIEVLAVAKKGLIKMIKLPEE